MNLIDLPPSVARAIARWLLSVPAPLLRRMAGPAFLRAHKGQALDVQIAALLGLNARIGPPPLEDAGADAAAARVRADRGLAALDAAPRPMAEVRDLARDLAAPVPIRLYRPSISDRDAGRGALRPAGYGPEDASLIFYHGGGGVIGTTPGYDSICRRLAADTGMPVLSVGYRLAPEHPFPAGIDDALVAYEWIATHGDAAGIPARRLVVSGDSMGGTFAAVVCQERQRKRLSQPALQALLYPGLDMTFSATSHREFAEGYLLTASLLEWFRDHYLADPHHAWDVRASPLFATDLAGLAPAVIVTAGFDPLCDDGALYAERLRRAQVPVRYRCEHGLVHGFIHMGGAIAAADRALTRLTTDICAALL